MANDGKEEPEVPQKEAVAPSKAGKPNIKPLESAPDEDKKPAEAAPEGDKPAETSAAKPATDETKPAEAEPGKSGKSAEGDEEATAAEQTEQQLAAEAEAAAKHDAEIQKLVDSKQFFLPINSVEKRRSKRVVLLGVVLSLLLALAWADVALDAGIIQINGVKPVTHFFSN